MASINSATKTFIALMTLGIIGLLGLVIFGNLSGNLGFASGTQGYNDTQDVIGNYTSGMSSFFNFASVWYILLGVTLLIIIVLAVVGAVRSSQSKFSG